MYAKKLAGLCPFQTTVRGMWMFAEQERPARVLQAPYLPRQPSVFPSPSPPDYMTSDPSLMRFMRDDSRCKMRIAACGGSRFESPQGHSPAPGCVAGSAAPWLVAAAPLRLFTSLCASHLQSVSQIKSPDIAPNSRVPGNPIYQGTYQLKKEKKLCHLFGLPFEITKNCWTSRRGAARRGAARWRSRMPIRNCVALRCAASGASERHLWRSALSVFASRKQVEEKMFTWAPLQLMDSLLLLKEVVAGCRQACGKTLSNQQHLLSYTLFLASMFV
ncbi:Protein of unknown function [Gryllus bimaculatus]|nr:Protein of unknown function [Gryllus bimaculatus]